MARSWQVYRQEVDFDRSLNTLRRGKPLYVDYDSDDTSAPHAIAHIKKRRAPPETKDVLLFNMWPKGVQIYFETYLDRQLLIENLEKWVVWTNEIFPEWSKPDRQHIANWYYSNQHLRWLMIREAISDGHGLVRSFIDEVDPYSLRFTFQTPKKLESLSSPRTRKKIFPDAA